MLPIRITLAGCSTRSVMPVPPFGSSLSPAAAACASTLAGTVPMGCPSGPTTTTCCSSESPEDVSLMSTTLRIRGEQDLAHVVARLHERVCVGGLGQRQRGVHDRADPALADQRPHVLGDCRTDRGLLRRRT